MDEARAIGTGPRGQAQRASATSVTQARHLRVLGHVGRNQLGYECGRPAILVALLGGTAAVAAGGGYAIHGISGLAALPSASEVEPETPNEGPASAMFPEAPENAPRVLIRFRFWSLCTGSKGALFHNILVTNVRTRLRSLGPIPPK